MSEASTPEPAVPTASGRGRAAVQLVLVLLIGGGALYLALRGVHLGELVAAARGADPVLFGVGALVFAGLHFIRALRWGRIVQAVKPEVTFRSYFSICSVGFLLINTLPFRLGEFARPTLLLEREGVPFGSGMATVVVERVLDVSALGVIFVGVLLFADLPSGPILVDGAAYDIVGLARTAILGVLVPVALGVSALLAMGDAGVRLARRALGALHPRLGAFAARFLDTFLFALRSLGSVRRAGPVLGWTAVVWTVNVLSIYAMAKAFAFGAPMGYWDGATILVCICAALIVPAPPGFAGVFELAVVISLAIYGVGKAEAFAFSAAVHGSQFAIIGAAGAAFLVIDRISLRRLVAGLRESAALPDEA